MSDRYRFLKTTEREGRVVAMIADVDRIGEAGVSSMRNAFRAHANPIIRDGVVLMNADQLRERLPELEHHGMANSVAAFQRAIQCISDREPHQAPPDQQAPGPASGEVREQVKPRRAPDGQRAPQQR